MKKSNALMLSYIIFLVSTLIARIFFKWDGLDRIAMATTIAGCFFAGSDYCGWRASFGKDCYDKFQELSDILVEFGTIKLDTIETENQQLSSAVDTFLPYKDEDTDITSWLIDANQLLDKNNQRKTEIQSFITKFDDLKPKITKGLKESVNIGKVGMGCAILGFIVFFMIIAFDYFVFVITPYQAIVTIIAFVIIMFTYYRKDVYEEKWKQDLSELKKRAEEVKQGAIKSNERAKQRNIEETLKKFRERKKQKSQLKIGDNNNG